MSLARLAACFGGGGPRDAEWGNSGHLGHMAGASARVRVLEAVEEELEERYAALGRLAPGAAAAARASQDPALLRRLYRFNLPAAELAHGRDLLHKLAAIDTARKAAEGDKQALAAQLKAAEASHRQAEFARARAEAIATARGEALMHAQQATREAEMQQLALAETLQQALAQLGIDLTPGKPSPLLTPLPAAGIATTPPAVRQSVFSAQQLAAVAASLSKLPNPRQSQHWLAAEAAAARAAAIEAEGQQQRQLEYEGRLQLEEREVEERRYRASQDAAQVAEVERQCRRASQRGSREQLHVSAGEAGRASGAANSEGQQLSGFTVYTNGLQTTEFVDSGDGEVAQQRPQRVSQPALRHSASAPASAAGGDLDSQGSGVQWRSISTAALSSHCRGSELGAGEEVAMVQQRGSRASSQQRREHQQRSSLEQLAADGWEDQQAAAAAEAGRLQQHARQLSKLVLPGLDASQLDSLVRIGASQQSPDPHRCPLSSVEVLQQLLPPGWQAAVGAQWDSGINPLQSDADAELLLRELRAEWQRQGAGTATTRPASRPGSRRVSQDGRPPVAQSMAAAVGQQERPTEQGRGRGMRAGSEPPGLLQVPMFDGKVAGAGTWVSPSLAAMMAHKKGHNPLLDGGEPSPPSHIKAVFGTTEDRDFYGPMAAHLNKQPKREQQPPAPQQPRPPTNTSAESIRGPARQQPPSARSSLDGPAAPAADWDRRQAQPQSTAAQQQPPPERRQAAFLDRFQPMGQYAQQAGPALSAAAHSRHQPPRRSSVTVHQLGGSQRSSVDFSDAGADENLAAAALGRSTVRGSGLPPRHGSSQQLQQAQVPETKRSLDSMRASMGGSGPGAANIKASLNAVEAAMAALREANPHLLQQQQQPVPPVAQSQPYGRVRGGGGGAHPPRPAAHHTRTRSLPEAALDLLQQEDLPLNQLSSEEHQRRRRESAAQAQAARTAYRA